MYAYEHCLVNHFFTGKFKEVSICLCVKFKSLSCCISVQMKAEGRDTSWRKCATTSWYFSSKLLVLVIVTKALYIIIDFSSKEYTLKHLYFQKGSYQKVSDHNILKYTFTVQYKYASFELILNFSLLQSS